MRAFWIVTDLALIGALLFVALVVGGVWYAIWWVNDEPPPDIFETKPIYLDLPVADGTLEEGHRITREDIRLEKIDAETMREYWPDLLNLIMMSPDQIAGRTLRRPLRDGDPFLTTAFYLEGREPGSPPESLDTADPPWPKLQEIALVSTKRAAAKPSTESVPRIESILLPNVAGDLPVGRVVRKSDVSLSAYDLEELREMALPEFEVLLSSQQIIGRRLLVQKRLGEPFLLSDFAVDGEVLEHLQRSLPGFQSRTIERLREEQARKWPPLHIEIPKRPTPPGEVPDNPEALFDVERAEPKVERDKPIVPRWRDADEEIDYGKLVESALAPLPAAEVGDWSPKGQYWFGGATLSPDPERDADESEPFHPAPPANSSP